MRRRCMEVRTTRYGTMNGVLRLRSSRVPGTRRGRPISGLLGSNVSNIVDDMKRNALRRCRIVLLDKGAQRAEVGNGLRRPNWRHERLATCFSFAPPQEATQSLTNS